MKVLYWNICNEVSPQASLNEVASLIQEQEIDVACLQEVPYVARQARDRPIHVPLSQILAEDLAMEQVFKHTRTITKSDEKIRGYGSAILSNSPIIEHEATTLREDRFSYMTSRAENKRVLLSVRTEADPDLMVAMAHLSYKLPLNIGKNGMMAEQKSLLTTLEQQMEQYDIVFGGDMNVRPGGLDRLLENTGLKSVLDNSEPTFRSRHWFAGHIKRNLDRVFATDGLHASGNVGGRRQSDHHPIIVEISKD